MAVTFGVSIRSIVGGACSQDDAACAVVAVGTVRAIRTHSALHRDSGIAVRGSDVVNHTM